MLSPRFRSFIAIALTVTFLIALSGHYTSARANHPGYYSGSSWDSGSYRLTERGHEYFSFGVDGRDGRQGRNGRSAPDEAAKTINLASNPLSAPSSEVSYNFSGAEGEPGENGTPGETAHSCRVPYRPPYSLAGADGGSGGNGGSGGDGGNGSDISIYYGDEVVLKQIAVANSGGQGGRSGRGEVGADGCECIEPAWVVKFCEWEVWQRQNPEEGQSEEPAWTYASRKIEPCTGVRNVDLQEHVPPIESRDYIPNLHSSYADDYRYELRYAGVSQTKRFGCKNGDRGQSGTDGRDGAKGRYGSFRLIPRADIPQEQLEYSGTLNMQLDQTVELVKNIWEERTGLRALLSPAADTPDSYSYLKSTERPKYRLEWAAAETPESLGVTDVSTGVVARSVGDRALLDLNIPGTLDYTLSEQSGVQVARITGGFSPDRVESFELESVFAKAGESKLVLIDKGDLRNLLPQTEIEISLLTKQSASGLTTDTYQPRHEATFYIRKGTEAIDFGNLNIVDNTYTFDLGNRFRAWLKPGYDALYRVKIQQTTNSGALYTQTEDVPFQVSA